MQVLLIFHGLTGPTQTDAEETVGIACCAGVYGLFKSYWYWLMIEQICCHQPHWRTPYNASSQSSSKFESNMAPTWSKCARSPKPDIKIYMGVINIHWDSKPLSPRFYSVLEDLAFLDYGWSRIEKMLPIEIHEVVLVLVLTYVFVSFILTEIW